MRYYYYKIAVQTRLYVNVYTRNYASTWYLLVWRATAVHPSIVAIKHSKLPKIVKTQSPYIKPVSKPVMILQSCTSSNSMTPTLCLHAIIESQHLHAFAEMSLSHITSDFKRPPVSPVRIVPIIWRITQTAEKNVNKLICKSRWTSCYYRTWNNISLILLHTECPLICFFFFIN